MRKQKGGGGGGGGQQRLVSRAVTRSQALATKASTLIELQGREAARFGEALIDTLIGGEGFQGNMPSQSRPINQTIKAWSLAGSAPFKSNLPAPGAARSKLIASRHRIGPVASPRLLPVPGGKGDCESAFYTVHISIKLKA